MSKKNSWQVVREELSISAHKVHIKNIERHGPLPPGFSIEEVNGKPQYVNPKTRFQSPDHPLKDVDANHNFFNEDVKRSTRKDVLGVSHPIEYAAGEWQWSLQDDGLKALFFALTNHNVIKDTKETRNAYQKRANELKAQADHSYRTAPLYHPGDRSLIIHDTEPLLSQMCREYRRDLIIATSEAKPGGRRVAQSFSKNPGNRDAIRFRRSTGSQEVWPPILLGCLTKFGATQNITWWYIMVPASQKMKDLYACWDTKCDWNKERGNFGLGNINDIQTIQWLVVSAHFAVLLGEIEERHLGNFIQQLLSFYNAERNKPYGRRHDFVFLASKKYKGPSISFHQLEARIRASGEGSWAHIFSERYDALLEAIDRDEHKKDGTSFLNKVKNIPLPG